MIRLSRPLPSHDSDQSPATGQRLIRWLRPLALLGLAALLGGCVWRGDGRTTMVRPDTTPSAPAPTEASPARPPEEDTHTAPMASAPATRPAPPAQTPAPPADLWARLRADFRLRGIDNPRIDAEVARLRRHPRALQRMLARARPYLHYIVSRVEARDLPGELALLPAVESGFQPHVYSSNGAAGLWQFMPATAHMLGLKQNRHYDGRRDIVRATEAALGYLQQLHDRLDDDWLHALAAYNCGIGTVKNAIRRAERAGHDTDYWQLDLPGETDDYIPRLLAVARIIDKPESLSLPDIPNRAHFQTVALEGPLDLEMAAELAGMPLERLLQLNPAFRQGIVPKGKYQLLLPTGRADDFTTALAGQPGDKRLRWADHRIRKGESLLAIAHHYHVSVAAIREANGLHGNLIRAGRRLRIPLSGRASDSARHIARARTRVHYRVRKGDSLYTIARRFSVTIADLRRWNQVGRYLHPGQRLTVYIRG